MFATRGLWLLLTVAAIAVGHFIIKNKTFDTLLRVSAQLSWLSQWYPDTYELNSCFNNLDHLFASWEQTLFNCQPSLEFSSILPHAFWSEAFCLGYVSYFPMIAILTFTVFWKEYHSSLVTRHSPIINYQLSIINCQYVSSVLLASFFIYYFIFIFVPVTGPQFYFCAVGVENIEAGHFPAMGHYFATHTDMLPIPGWTRGIFHNLVATAHAAGERPTAAFPSSHIGATTIMLFLARRHAPNLLWFFIPLWVLLCFATVYIQAHYLIDAIAGLISAPIVYWLAKKTVQLRYIGL